MLKVFLLGPSAARAQSRQPVTQQPHLIGPSPCSTCGKDRYDIFREALKLMKQRMKEAFNFNVVIDWNSVFSQAETIVTQTTRLQTSMDEPEEDWMYWEEYPHGDPATNGRGDRRATIDNKEIVILKSQGPTIGKLRRSKRF